MGRKGNHSSSFKGSRPDVFKQPCAVKPVAKQPSPTAPNSMGSAVMSGVGVGIGAAAGSAVFNTIANTMSSSRGETDTQQPIDTKKEYCNLIQKQFYECLGRDLGNSCHDLQYLLVKGNCNE